MNKKDSQDVSKKDFQRHNELACKNYHQPSPKCSKPTKFDTLVYVATTFDQKPKTCFNHSDASPFQPVVPGKK